MKNLFKLAYQLVFRGKWAVKILTVLLSAFSFALFALASTAYTYSEKGYILKNYLHDLERNPLLLFYNSLSYDRNVLRSEDIALIKKTFPSLEYLYNINEGSEIPYYLHVGNYVQIDQDNLNLDDIQASEDWCDHVRNILSFRNTYNIISATPKLFDEAGYEILEGRYPTAENEIAIDLSLFEVFEWGGYSPSESEAAVKIHEYSDMLGKSLGTNEVIVGVYDVHSITKKSEWLQNCTETLIIRSEAWRTEQKQENLSVEAMFVPDVSELVSYQFAEQLLDVTETMLERFYARHPDIEHNISSIGAYGLASYLNDVGLKAGFVDQNLLAFMFGCAGIVFLIFSVILNSYIITAIMGKKQKQIGLLRALGTPQKRIAEIFILGILYLAAIIFIVALILSMWVYFGFLEPWLIDEDFAVAPMQYNGWTVLILFAVSFITPVLSVLLPIKKFFRSSVVENIKGTTSKRKEKNHV